MDEKTLGEERIRIDLEWQFQSAEIANIMKQETANIINTLEEAKKRVIRDIPDSEKRELGEFIRLISLAQTSYEEASMWATKAMTKF